MILGRALVDSQLEKEDMGGVRCIIKSAAGFMKRHQGIRMVENNTRSSVLVVDDEDLVLKFLAKVVESAGFTPITADSAESALETLKSVHEEVCLVITDVTMPGMSGLDLARKIRKQAPSLPVIVVSGYSHDEIDMEGLPEGVLFRQKPLNLHEIQDLVSHSCDVA